MNRPAEIARRDESYRAYYDASQFRVDTWNELKELTARRERYEKSGRATDEIQRQIVETLEILEDIEAYFSFPGRRVCRQLQSLMKRGLYIAQARQTERVVRLLVGDLYRRRDVSDIFHEDFDNLEATGAEIVEHVGAGGQRPYFEVLVVDEVGTEPAQEIRKRMLGMRRDQDQFVYDVVVVGTFEDAVIGAALNHNVQSVVVRYSFPFESATKLPQVRASLSLVDLGSLRERPDKMPARALGEALKALRPELDLFLVTDDPVRNIAGHTGRSFSRVFYHQEDYLELHLSILRGIHDRYETPFFNALREYSHRPTGVFHALPISRGKSVLKSHWIRDMGQFYGENIFLAETSATSGGLDSLLQPHGPIKKAQEKVARAFGAKKSYFVTNGTSTANKIVVQALVSPGDIALVSRDCHKSHHYALVLAGALPVYLDPYPVQTYSMYGAVPLREIKRSLLELKRAGKLDRVRMLLLTNCTFDGVVYDPERVMREVLAIKPDIVFVWDEAWFGFARFSPTYRQRTAMESARRLKRMLASEEYRERYQAWRSEHPDEPVGPEGPDAELLPDPDRARIRVYSTQSTHKTLTALRQGSMIHVYDQDFGRLTHEAFDEAYMTHTSTSPNYQILASLDVGRRQVELEGFELVEKSIALAMTLRERIQESPLLNRYFQVLKARDLIPGEYRPSGLEEFYSPRSGYAAMGEAWRKDEFTIDPTRLTVHVGLTCMDGDTLRNHLMDRYDIQINKTSRNTLLFMLNIGSTRGAVAYLLEVLGRIARELDETADLESDLESRIARERIDSLTKRLPPLPNFSRFHARFASEDGATPEGDLRSAFFLARQEDACDFLRLDGSVQKAMEEGREIVSAGFVTPYPPGFPVLVPGQVLSREILDYLKALDVKEIHGYNPEFGLRVFAKEVLMTDRKTIEAVPEEVPT
jgi:arginine decarboxylase